MTAVVELPFEDSRRLTGPNPWFAGVGAVLETLAPASPTPALLGAWRGNVERMYRRLGWPVGAIVARVHRGGASLAIEAPADRLLCATEVNEWAWAVACGRSAGFAPGHPASWDEDQAGRSLAAMARAQAAPSWLALIEAGAAHRLPVLWGEDRVSIGSGRGGRDYPEADLPPVATVPWTRLYAVPTALVTGSNGKTTTVRLVAAMLRASGRRVGLSCTDGLFVEDQRIESGDYSGPVGTRTVLRRHDIDAAVLETARGGILRRGLAVARADAAIVTNISADHFGEYGVHSLADLANAKLAVARAIDADGLMVLNADDPVLRAAAGSLGAPLGWFSLDPEAGFLRAQAVDRPACVLRDAHLWLHPQGIRASATDLGPVAAMPLSVEGLARYNIANLAGAALMAHALGVDVGTVRRSLAQFGADNADNRGRLEHWRIAGAEVWLDFAHNPEGIAGLLDIVAARRGNGRLGIILGHAGNRLDEEIRAVARTAAHYRPERVVLKEIKGYERGRALGEVAGLMRAELVANGVAAGAIDFIADEVEAARSLLEWARPGDQLVLLIHALPAKHTVATRLDALAAAQ